MVERFLRKTSFTSVDDYQENLEFIVPENFNFAYDVVDAWAEEKPISWHCYGPTTKARKCV